MTKNDVPVRLTPEQATAEITKKRQGIYFFCGEEDYLKRRTVERIEKALGCAEFDRADIDLSDRGTPDMICDALMTPPMMGDCRLVTVCGFDADHDTARTLEGIVQPVFSAAGIGGKKPDPAELGDDPFPGIVLILISRSQEFTLQKKTLSTAAFKRFASVFKPVEFPLQSEARLCDWVVRSLGRVGLKISGQDALCLCDRCAGNMYILRNELDKLEAVNVGKKAEVSRADIDRYVVSSARDVPFALSNAVMNGDGAAMIRLIAEEKAKKSEPVSLCAMISSSVCEMLRVRYAISARLSRDAAAQKLKMNSYRVGLYYNAVARIPEERLEALLSECYSAEMKLKSSRADPWMILDRLCILAARDGVPK